MKLHTDWLLQYLDTPIPPRELVDAMPRAALEVEAEEPAGSGFQIELKVLPNRPDCLGVLGISREMAAIFDIGTKWPADVMPAVSGDEKVSVTIEEPDLCRRFTAAVFRGVKVGPSPQWMQTVLQQAGLRPINNVVDITNFVMLETGQPSHAFDLAKLAGGRIVVRKIKLGETLDQLVGKPLDASYGDLLCVCDAEKPQALAGIMGGKTAGTESGTTDVLLEMAYFDPVHVRRNVKIVRNKQGSGGSDSSYRFERGVDPNAMLDRARRRAYSLMVELTGGTLAGPPTDVIAKPTEPKTFKLSAERVSRLIGAAVDAATVKSSLEKLGYGVADDLTVTVPTFRVDVNDPVVLAEDVARMIGYDNIRAADRPSRATRGQDCVAGRLRSALNKYLVDSGWLETKNDPLEAEAKASPWLGTSPDAIVLRNAATVEMNALRRTLIGGLLASVQRNVFRGVGGVRLFEIDRTFAKLPGTWTLAGVCGGTAGPTAWRGATSADFFTLKGTLEDAFDAAGLLGVGFVARDVAPGLAGATAAITLGDVVVGWAGELDPKLAKVDRLSFKLFGFEIDLSLLEPHFGRPPAATALNRLPAAVRDIAVVAKLGVAYADVERTVRAAAGPSLEKIELADEYRGKPVPPDSRSLALRLTFRDPVRTLTADEVQTSVDAVVKRLAEELAAALRT